MDDIDIVKKAVKDVIEKGSEGLRKEYLIVKNKKILGRYPDKKIAGRELAKMLYYTDDLELVENYY